MVFRRLMHEFPGIGTVIHKLEMRQQNIPNTGRVERIIKLIIYLQEWRSVKDIAGHLEVSKKSVHRYNNLLVKLGFDVEVRMGKYHFYRITNAKEIFKIQ